MFDGIIYNNGMETFWRMGNLEKSQVGKDNSI